MSKLFAIDLDGTFLNNEFKPTEENINAVKNAQDAGAIVAIATGRTRFDVEHLFRESGVSTWIIGANGATISNADGEIVDATPIEPIYAKEIAKWLTEENYYFEMITASQNYVPKRAKEVLLNELDVVQEANRANKEAAKERQFGQAGRKEIDDYIKVFQAEEDIYKITIVAFDDERRNRAEKVLAKKGLKQFSSADFNVEIVDGKVSKGTAIEKIAKQKNINSEDIVAIGDSMNDIPMLEAAGTKVAMGNAKDEVKEASDYVTSKNEENGVAEVIQKELRNK